MDNMRRLLLVLQRFLVLLGFLGFPRFLVLLVLLELQLVLGLRLLRIVLAVLVLRLVLVVLELQMVLQNLIFITIALVAIVNAGPGEEREKGPGEHKRGGKHHGFPSFFGNVSAEGRKEIAVVFKNENLTLAQADTQIASLAEKYGFAAAYKEHKEKEAVRQAETKKNTTTVINNLSSVATKLSAIRENKDQTRKAQHEAIEALRNENGVEVDTIEFIAKRSRGFGGRHGGRKGGKGGKHFGKKNGDKKRGPHGGDEEGKKTKEAAQ